MCERCQQGKDELSQVCEIYFGAVLKNLKENVTMSYKHFILEISAIFSKEDLLVCLILYFVIENFPDCFPCTSHHLPLGAGQGNLRWNCNYSQILIQKPYLLTNTKTKKLQFRPNTNEKDFNYSHLQIWWDRFNQGDSPSTISPTVTLAGINEMWD